MWWQGGQPGRQHCDRSAAALTTPVSMPGHAPHAGAAVAVGCAVLTVSDTRTPETDTSGGRMRALLEAAGHRVVAYAILPDDPARIRDWVAGRLAAADVDAVLVNGGTGLAPRDTTYEAVEGLLEKRLDGFGELFRMLSFAEIGAAAMLSRAIAGVARGRAVFSLPGSTAAVELGMTQLVVPALGHVVRLVRG
jgi:molybdenum cofactor biosynthesis protein B